jgi:hypothetical protein
MPVNAAEFSEDASCSANIEERIAMPGLDRIEKETAPPRTRFVVDRSDQLENGFHSAGPFPAFQQYLAFTSNKDLGYRG